jgi:hypothetical protein
MPLDDRWDKLDEAQWASFADSWLAELRSGHDSEDDKVGMSVTWMGFTARPEQQWKFICLATSRATSDEELGHIAAGPVECLLGHHGPQFIDEVERLASIDSQFARMLMGVWTYMIPDDVWAKLQAVQARVPNPLASSGSPKSDG